MNPTTTSAIFFLLCLYFGQGDAACGDVPAREAAVTACKNVGNCQTQNADFLDNALNDIKDGGCALCLADACDVDYVDGRCQFLLSSGQISQVTDIIYTRCSEGANSCVMQDALENKKCADCLAFACAYSVQDLLNCKTPCSTVDGFLDTTCKECVVKAMGTRQPFMHCSTFEQPLCGVGSCTLAQVFKVGETLANNAQDACFGACFDLTKPSDDATCSDCITGACTGTNSSGTRMSKTSVLPLLFAVYWKWMA